MPGSLFLQCPIYKGWGNAPGVNGEWKREAVATWLHSFSRCGDKPVRVRELLLQLAKHFPGAYIAAIFGP